MKKTTFTLLSIISLITTLSFGQINTPLIELSTTSGLEYSAKIEISSTTVTLTMIGPSNRWLALGFGVPLSGGVDHPMSLGGDVVIYDDTLDGNQTGAATGTLTDRRFLGMGVIPELDVEQDWILDINDVVNKVRTLVAHRSLDGGSNDYKFTTDDSSITLAWARGNFDNFNLDWHNINRGTTMESFHPLGLDDHKINTFSISPNPGKTKLNLKLSRLNTNTNLEVFDVLGKKIYENRLTDATTSIDVSKWNSGVYLVRVSTDTGVQTKRFVKQ